MSSQSDRKKSPTPAPVSDDRSFDPADGNVETAAVEGEERVQRRFFHYRDGVDVTRPLERVEIDEWKVSLDTLLTTANGWGKLSPEQQKWVSGERTWLTAAVDVKTRCILALRVSAGTPSVDSALAGLRMVVKDKTELSNGVGATTPWEMRGTPEAVVTDCGAAFISPAFRRALRDLRSDYLNPPAGLPGMRGRIERVFGMLCTANIEQSFENVIARADCPAQDQVSLFVDEFNHVVIPYVVDCYHNTPDPGLLSETPRNCWDRLSRLYGVIPPPSEDEQRHIFG